MRSEVADAMDLDVVRYAQVWEDHRVLEQALEVGPGDDVLSIGSAGCNALALLLQEPRRVVAIDMSPAQIALIHLKLAAIGTLDADALAVLLGARGGDRGALYAGLRRHLPEPCRQYWDARPADVAAGVMHCGRLERFLQGFQHEHLYRIHPRGLVDRFLQAPDLAAQAAAFRELATDPFKAALVAFAQRDALATRGRDPAQMKYVGEQDTGAELLERFRRVCTAVPARDNFYLEYTMTASYRNLDAGPPFLRPAHLPRLQKLLPRLEVVQDELERYLLAQPEGTFSKANLSDIFEYVSPEATERLLSLLASRMRAGGRIAYWNLFVSRHRPASLAGLLEPLPREAGALFAADRAWFYGALHIERVR